MNIQVSKKNDPMQPYHGNTERATAKDARYSIKLDGSVQLMFTIDANERALLTTDAHPELVEMVNEAKLKGGASQRGGQFIIDEYRHVLVPTQSGETLFAGTYTRDLEFEFERALVTPVAPAGTKAGEVWPGPHVGVKYTLAAGATDVRYEKATDRGTLKKVRLTEEHSAEDLRELLGILRKVKPDGGAIYINEGRELFAPVSVGKDYRRCYIGHLGVHPWFADPH